MPGDAGITRTWLEKGVYFQREDQSMGNKTKIIVYWKDVTGHALMFIVPEILQQKMLKKYSSTRLRRDKAPSHRYIGQ